MKTITKLFLLIFVACGCSILIYYTVEKVKPVKEIEDVLLTQYEIEEDFLENTNYSVNDPKVILNPYGNSPLTALIIFETGDLTTPTITIKGKDANTTFTHTFTPNKKHILPIYGLYPNTDNEVVLKVNKTTKVIHIQTEKLPDDFILPTSVQADKTKLNDELYFVTPSSSGYTAAYDVNGDVRWYITNSYIWDIKRLENGNLLLSSDRLINPPYYTTGLVEIDLLGKIYYEYTLPGGYHHDVFEMEDGNLLVASNNFESGTVEDYIVLLDRNTGEILKEIDLKDILDTNTGKSPYWTSYDWFHNNSVWYDKKTNSITLSGRHQDAVINIDFEANEINWILGDNTNWSEEYQKYFLTPTSENFVWQYAQHAAMILPNGDVFLFDNGNNRSKIENYVKANDNYSRGVIFRINKEDMTVEEIWQYGKERGSSYYSPYISDVDYLEENHYIIHSGGHSYKDGIVSNNPASFGQGLTLQSYTTELLNDKVIFEMVLPTNLYRVEKLKLYDNNTYSTGLSQRLGNMGITKTDKNYAFLLFNKDIDSTYEKHNISITKEIDRLVVSGTFQKEDKVEIILDSLFHKKVYTMRISKKPYTAMCVDIFNEEENELGIKVTKYINDIGLKGKYYIYIKINGTIYDINQYIEYESK